MWKNCDGKRVKVLERPPPFSSHPRTVFETDPATLTRRLKQIDYGKNTPEYVNYLNMVPKETRTSAQPKTPDRRKKTSRRAWDGEIRIWRLLLHAYNPTGQKDQNEKAVQQPTTTSSSNHSPESMGQQQQQPYSFRGYNFSRVSFSNKQL